MISCRVINRVLYVDIPKASSTSVKTAFGIPHLKISWHYGDIWEEINHLNIVFSFTFVRHPIARLLSTYTMYKQTAPEKLSGCGFDEFIHKAIHDMKDVHYRPQFLMLPIRNNKILLDKVYKQENIKEHWEELKQRFSWPDLPIVNKNKPMELPKLTDYQFDALKDKYSYDFQILNYEPDQF